MKKLYRGLLSGASFLAAERATIHVVLSLDMAGIVDIMQHLDINRVIGMIIKLRLF